MTMALCKDKAVTTLNSLGFDVVRFPRPDIAPLDVIIKASGSFKRLAPLPSLWQSPAPLPEVIEHPVPNLSTIQSSELRGALGIGAIMDIFSKAEFSAAAKHTKSVRLVALEPKVMRCDQSAIENFVTKGDVNPEEVATRHFLDEQVNTYIITEVIASSKLKIIVGGETNVEAKASAADISGAISASAEIGTVRCADNEIVYERENPAVFGFILAEILYDNQWLVDLPKKPGKAFLGRGAQPVVQAPHTRMMLTDVEL
jgi:hypothetical protein